MNLSEDILKGSTKLISKANKLLTHIKDPKDTELVAILKREIGVLIERKACVAK